MANFESPDTGSVRSFPLVPESVSTRDTARRLGQGFFTDPPEALPPEPECESEWRLLTPPPAISVGQWNMEWSFT
jgi:hypothetical protein